MKAPYSVRGMDEWCVDEVACPRCGQPVGERCRWLQYPWKVCWAAHAERKEAAKALVAERGGWEDVSDYR